MLCIIYQFWQVYGLLFWKMDKDLFVLVFIIIMIKCECFWMYVCVYFRPFCSLLTLNVSAKLLMCVCDDAKFYYAV